LLAWLQAHGVDKVVMEASGGYDRSWANFLRGAGLEVLIVDPKRVRHFAKSAGQLAKNDPIDARMIAWFGEVFDDTPGQPHDEDRHELDQLVTSRLGVRRLKEQIEAWGEHEQPKVVQKVHQALLKAVATQLAKLEAIIAAKPRNDMSWRGLSKRRTSPISAAKVTATGTTHRAWLDKPLPRRHRPPWNNGCKPGPARERGLDAGRRPPAHRGSPGCGFEWAQVAILPLPYMVDGGRGSWGS
jgi:transposase